MKREFLLVLAFCSACFFSATASAEKTEASPKQIWQLIDYVGVDYSGAVVNGAIASEAEFAEMRDFTAQALQQAKALPDNAGKAELLRALVTLREAVERKADSGQVSTLARAANARLLAAYPMPVAPKDVPDLKRGAAIFQAQCASCHGATGRADGPLAASLDPPPIAFVDRERAASRSVMALYQAVSQGVSGTAMPAFGTLTEEERWAVALYAGTLSHDEAMRARGEKAWKNDPKAKIAFPDLTALATHTEAELTPELGADTARDLMAYLRSKPATVTSSSGGLTLAKARLQESLAAAHAGDKATAMRLGLSAYLDGFEPVEPTLSVRDKALVTGVETAMLEYRGALERGSLTEAQAVAERLNTLFGQAETTLKAGAADATTAFAGALTILLREGVEALLIVVGMIAFLRKAGRTDVLRYVHAGWVVALLAGGLTWAVATYVVDISGASREVTEGLSSLFAAVVLLSVGLWMHQKSSAGRWQAYLKEKLSSALSRRSALALFSLSFLAVYREVFETVLFFSALAAEGSSGALLAGLATGIVILGIITWVLLRTSTRMPIGKFFAASSVLVAVLAVVLAGKGAAGLQEAGWLTSNPMAWPHVDILGMYPSVETATAQLLVLLVALAGFSFNMLQARQSEKSR